MREEIKVFNKLLGTKGLYSVTAEECGELIQSLMKMDRIENGDPTVNIASNKAQMNIDEEIADVLICIQRLIDANGSSDRVEFYMNKKIDRTYDRLRSMLQKSDNSVLQKSEIKVERKIINGADGHK